MRVSDIESRGDFTLQECVATLMILLADCVSSMKKEDIKTYQSNLFDLFLEAFDFRVQHNQEVSNDILLLSSSLKSDFFKYLREPQRNYSSAFLWFCYYAVQDGSNC